MTEGKKSSNGRKMRSEMSTGNKVSIVIVVAFLAVMCFVAGIYTPWNALLVKTIFFDTPEPIVVQTFTPAPTRTPTIAPNATFTTMPSPTKKLQTESPAPTRTFSPTATATNKVYPTFEPIILQGKVKQEVAVREKAGDTSKIVGKLVVGSEVIIVDGTTLCEGCPLWDQIYFPLGQTETTGWIPSLAIDYATETPVAHSKNAPYGFIVFYDDGVWRVLTDDPKIHGIINAEGDIVFDNVNTIEAMKLTSVKDDNFSGRYPLGATLYVANAGMNVVFKAPYVWLEGDLDLDKSSVEVNSNKDSLTFTATTKWGTVRGTIDTEGNINLQSQPALEMTSTPTVTPTQVPTKVATPRPLKPVTLELSDGKHTFSYVVIAPTYAYSNPNIGDAEKYIYLPYGRLVEPLYQWTTDKGILMYLAYALDAKNQKYEGSGWIPASAVKSLLPNPEPIPTVPPFPSE